MDYPISKNLSFSLEKRFFFLEYRETLYAVLFYLKQKVGEIANFFYQNHGLTPFEKCHFFGFFYFLFLLSTKAFFSLEYRQTHISLLFR